jgi:hypothetical protein
MNPPPPFHSYVKHTYDNSCTNPLFFTYCYTCLYHCLVEPKFQTLFSSSEFCYIEQSSLSSKSSGRKCSVIFRYKSNRHVWHTGDDKKWVLWSNSIIISWIQKMSLSVDYFCLFLPIYYCSYLYRLLRYR